MKSGIAAGVCRQMGRSLPRGLDGDTSPTPVSLLWTREGMLMVAERWKADAGELLVLEEGSALWGRPDERSVPDFGRVEVRGRPKRYLAGWLARIDRTNGWQIAEAIGEDGP